MSIQDLIQKYEAELRMIGIDQRTDDAMPPDAYQARRDVLERVIADLKAVSSFKT
jgi:hypothetical protein